MFWGVQAQVEASPKWFTPPSTEIGEARSFLKTLIYAERARNLEEPALVEPLASQDSTVGGLVFDDDVPVQSDEGMPITPPAVFHQPETHAEPIMPAGYETVASETPPSNVPESTPSGAEKEPEAERPWGALTTTIFLFLVSLSANVFLGWQLWEEKTKKGSL